MTAEQNIETARQMYQAFGRGDVRAILDLVTDDVDWSTDAAIASAPWYGPRHGKDGVAGFFEAVGKTGPVTEFTPLAYASNDDGDVMVFLRYAFTATATGRHVEMKRPQFRGHRPGRRGPDAPFYAANTTMTARAQRVVATVLRVNPRCALHVPAPADTVQRLGKCAPGSWPARCP